MLSSVIAAQLLTRRTRPFRCTVLIGLAIQFVVDEMSAIAMQIDPFRELIGHHEHVGTEWTVKDGDGRVRLPIMDEKAGILSCFHSVRRPPERVTHRLRRAGNRDGRRTFSGSRGSNSKRSSHRRGAWLRRLEFRILAAPCPGRLDGPARSGNAAGSRRANSKSASL